jgi:2Fe-2S ferredoxin
MSTETLKITFVLNDGTEVLCHAREGENVLNIAHQNNVDLEGACECSLACSTCHVVVDPEWFDKLDEISDAEDDMLDLAFGLTETSRLGCQIIMKKEFDGLVVKLPSATRNIKNDNKN